MTEGANDVNLLCTTKADLAGNIKVEWRRSVPHYKIIHMYENGSNQPEEGYRGRTEMKGNITEGTLTLNLKNPQLDDGGVYICTVFNDGNILRQKIVVLSVRGQFCIIRSRDVPPESLKSEPKLKLNQYLGPSVRNCDISNWVNKTGSSEVNQYFISVTSHLSLTDLRPAAVSVSVQSQLLICPHRLTDRQVSSSDESE